MTSGSINAWNVTISNSQLGSVGAAVSVDANGSYLKVLNNSTVYGSLTVDNTYGKLTIDSTSRVYGTCKAESKPNTNNNVIGICSPLPASSVNHYRLSYSSQALTCQAQTVTVTACTDAACSSSYTAGSSSLTVTPGGAAISFTGSTTISIALRSAGTVTLAVSNANPPPVGDTLCRIDGAAASTNCNLTFADSGLLVQAPDLLAGQSDTLSVTAVRKSDNSAACVPAFANVTRPVAFWSIYVDPDAATQKGNRAVSVAATSVANSSAGSTSVDLAFDAQGTARVALNYFDAGQVQLNALYQGNATRGDAGLTMSGSDSFVSRPASLGIVATRPDGSLLDGSACLDASGAPTLDASGCGTWKAGDDFTLTITPLAADGSTVTPNFRLSGIALSSTLLAPSGGVDGSLAPSSYDHPLGGAYGLNVRHSEVGVFRLGAAAQGSYFGYDVSGQSGAVGRFTPAYLDVSASAQLQPSSCKDANNNDIRSAFSYQGQEITFRTSPSLTITAMNAQGNVTRNYDLAPFWGLNVTGREPYVYPPFKGTDEGARSARLKGRWESLVKQKVSLDDEQPVEEGANDGDGRRIYRWPNDSLRWMTSLAPTDDDLPFGSTGSCTSTPSNGNCIARLVVKAVERDNTADEKVCFAPGDGWTGASACTEFTYDFGGSEVRLGRLRFGNAFGSELQALDVPFWLEYWGKQEKNGVTLRGFFPTPLGALGDACSAPKLSATALSPINRDDPDVLQAADFPKIDPPDWDSQPTKITLSPPKEGKTGSINVSIEKMGEWLWYDWSGSATREAGHGLATFGVYKGSDALIFRRETYR